MGQDFPETVESFTSAVCTQNAVSLNRHKAARLAPSARIIKQQRKTRMAKSIVYISLAESLSKGRINFAVDKFRMLLVNNNYTVLSDATKRTHKTRTDVTPYETYGFGYTQSGSATIPGPGQVIPTVLTPSVDNRSMEVSFTVTPWLGVSFVTTGGVIYKFADGTTGGNDLVGYVDFGQLWSFSNQNCDPVIDKNLRFEV